LDKEPDILGLVVVVQDREFSCSGIKGNSFLNIVCKCFTVSIGSESEFADCAIWIGVGEEGSHLRCINFDIFLILSNVKSELGSFGIFDSNFFSSTNNETDWDCDRFLEISTLSIKADINGTAEISSFGCINNEVLIIVEG